MKKQKKGIIVLCFAILLLFIFWQIKKEENAIELTQFTPMTANQMMGYGMKTRQGKIILIDGGNPGDSGQLLDYIKQNGSEVEAWFLTHIHADHAGAFTEVIKDPSIRVKKVYVSYAEKEWYEQYEPKRQSDIDLFFKTIEEQKPNIIEPSVGETIVIDNVSISIRKTKTPDITTNAINNSSMVFQVKVNQKKILFLGDTGEEASKWLLTHCSKEQLKSDIVQVAHHGQKGATEELYQTIGAKECLWPTTKWLWNNDNGGGEDSGPWETKKTRNWMRKMGVTEHILAYRSRRTLQIY